MSKKIILLLLSAALMAACSNNQKGSERIRINEAKHMQVNLSDYVISLEYVPLETKAECLIDRNPGFYVLDEYIVVTTSQQCFLFDRSGKFIREIGRAGRGPDEYSNATWRVIDEKKQTILMPSWNQRIEYSVDGEVFRYFPIIPGTLTATAYESDSILVLGVRNSGGDAVNQLVFINQEKIVDSIPNYQFFKPLEPNMSGGFGNEFYFYRNKDDLYYKNLFNDTIFSIKDRKLHPAWVFDMGTYHLSRSIMANANTFMRERMKYNSVMNILEAEPFLLFSIVSERGDSAYIFDKAKSRVFVLQKEQKLKGFYNDIDGGMPFWPVHINQKQELVSFLYPDEMKEMLTNEYFESKNIRDEASNIRLKELIRRLKEEDNPVVVIAKLK